MAELVGVVSSAITFAALAVQVGKCVRTLKDFRDSMRDAPDDLKDLVREIEVFGSIMADIDADLSRNPVALAMISSQHGSQSLQFCKDAVETLDVLCKELLQDLGSSNRLRRSYQAAKIVLRQRKIEKHISKLHNVVRLLMLSQQCYTRYPLSVECMGCLLTDKTRALIQVQPDLIARRMAQYEAVSSSTDDSKPSVAPHGGSIFALLSIEDRSSPLTDTSIGLPIPKKQKRDHRNSSYLWLLRAPTWMTSRVLEVSGMKAAGGWDWMIRTYTEIRWSSELDYYLTEGKIQNLQDLFGSGQLSPLVRTQGSGRSLLHVSTIFIQHFSYSALVC